LVMFHFQPTDNPSMPAMENCGCCSHLTCVKNKKPEHSVCRPSQREAFNFQPRHP